MAGLRESILTTSTAWRAALALCLALCIVGTSAAETQKVYDLDLRAQSVADALNGLSAQTGAPVVFPYDLVKDRKANPVIGRYTLQAALNALLEGTGLSGGLSDKGVLTVSPENPGTAKRGETRVTHEKEQNTNKTTGARPAGMATFFASMAAFSASAQEVGIDQNKIEDVVITAQKREERLQDVPVPVTALNADQLADSNQVLLRDYYTSVPAFTVSPNYAGQQMLSIRGITTGGFTNPTVGVLIDDVPYGTSTFFSGNQVPDIDPGDLARVEVLRGPQGTLYGSNSMGGLLKFVTVDPSTTVYSGRLEAGTDYVHNGAEPGYNLRGSVNVPITDTLAIRASGFTREDPGYIDNPVMNENGVNEMYATGGRVSALWRPSEVFSLKLNALYEHSIMDGSSDVDIQPGLGDLQQNYIHGIGGYDRTVQAYSAILKARFGGVDLTSVTGYGINKFTASLDFTSVFGPAVEKAFGAGGAAYLDFNDVSKFSQELRLTGSLWQSFDWLVGAFFTHENSPEFYQFPGVVPATGEILGQYWDATSHNTFQEYAGFADLTYHFTDQFDVQVGGRESRITVAQLENVSSGPFVGPVPSITPEVASTADTFTYLVTPRFKLSPDLMLYARLASGYRPGGPQLTAVIAQGAPPAYNPDKTKNYEIGLKGDFFDHTLTVDGSVYYIDWKQIQIQLETPEGFAYDANGGAAKSEGTELTVESRPLTGLAIAAWVAYDDAVLTEAFPAGSTAYGVPGNRLPNSTRWSGNLSVQQDFPLPNGATGFVGATASYVGDRLSVFQSTDLRQRFPSYTKTDLRAGLRYDAWTFNLYANNVADVRGVLNGGIGFDPPFAFDYIQPRTIGVSLVRLF
jgi:iron complex outermembrane recepter protein